MGDESVTPRPRYRSVIADTVHHINAILLAVAVHHAHNTIDHVSQALISEAYHTIVFLLAPNDHQTVAHAPLPTIVLPHEAHQAAYEVSQIATFQNHVVDHIQTLVPIPTDHTSFVALKNARDHNQYVSFPVLLACELNHIATHLVAQALRNA